MQLNTTDKDSLGSSLVASASTGGTGLELRSGAGHGRMDGEGAPHRVLAETPDKRIGEAHASVLPQACVRD